MKEQKVIKVDLNKKFRFLYSNFVTSSQTKLHLILTKRENILDVIEFDLFFVYKFGYPNDEVSHPLTKYGLGNYGFFEVQNSEWIEQLRQNNSSHSSHSDSIYNDLRHFIAKFKDVTLEIIADDFELKTIKQDELIAETIRELNNLDND